MNIAVLGTGIVAKTIADKLSALGHAVKLGTRDVSQTLARNEPDMAGGPAIRVWLETHPKVSLVPFAEAAAHGEIVVNALSGTGSLDGLALAGATNLEGKLLLDISNPLDFSRGMPPSLTVANTDSLGEQIQRAYQGEGGEDAQHGERVLDGVTRDARGRRAHCRRPRAPTAPGAVRP